MTKDTSVYPARLCAAVSGVLFVLVLAVGGLRSAREKPPSPVATHPPENALSAFASDRDSLRAREISQLEAALTDPASSSSLVEAARARMMELYRWMELEATISEVLGARGYELPVVTVHSDSVNVVVRSDGLDAEEAGIILELVVRETGISGGNVKIIPIN